jgi:hypothetical protein
MSARDTTPNAAAAQRQAHEKMGPAGRLKVALELSELAHQLALSGIHKRHPEYTREQAVAALVTTLYGKAR